MSNQFRPSPSVTAEELDDGICLFHSESNEVLVLNETAADIWRLATDGLVVSKITDQLASTYQATPESLSDDVSTVIQDLLAKDYLRELTSDRDPAA